MPRSVVYQPAQTAEPFATTQWSAVLRAGEDSSPEARQALEQLCASYRFPLYAYIRRQGHNIENAQDLTQEFFARLLERKPFHLADRTRGRFRTFLLTSLKHFLINEWKQANRQKRGGGCQFISRDGAEMKTHFLAEPADHRSPDKAFGRQWALVVLGRVLDQLQSAVISRLTARPSQPMPGVYNKTYLRQMNEDDSESFAAQLVARGALPTVLECIAAVMLLKPSGVRVGGSATGAK